MGRGTNGSRSLLSMCLNVVVLVCAGLAIAAFVISLENQDKLKNDVALKEDALWQRDGTVTQSIEESTEVEIKAGNDLSIFGSLIHKALGVTHSVIARVNYKPVLNALDPSVFQAGLMQIIGSRATDALYTSMQAFRGIGLWVADRNMLPGSLDPDIFSPVGLFQEPGLVMFLGSFATWLHGPFIVGGPILTPSDASLKQNITSLDTPSCLAAVSHLEPRSYTWKASGMQARGFVAQEVQAVLPGAVGSSSTYLGDSAGEKLLLNRDEMLPDIVGAIQALWSNGVITAAETHAPSATCLSANSDSPRAAARCVCTLAPTLICAEDASCVRVQRACGM